MAKARVTVHSRYNKETGERESLDDLMRRFKKIVISEGIIQDYKKHDFFLKKGLRRKLKSEEAAKRERRKGHK